MGPAPGIRELILPLTSCRRGELSSTLITGDGRPGSVPGGSLSIEESAFSRRLEPRGRILVDPDHYVWGISPTFHERSAPTASNTSRTSRRTDDEEVLAGGAKTTAGRKQSCTTWRTTPTSNTTSRRHTRSIAAGSAGRQRPTGSRRPPGPTRITRTSGTRSGWNCTTGWTGPTTLSSKDASPSLTTTVVDSPANRLRPGRPSFRYHGCPDHPPPIDSSSSACSVVHQVSTWEYQTVSVSQF